MHHSQFPFREIYNGILGYQGERLLQDVLSPWVKSQDEWSWSHILNWDGSEPPRIERSILWDLYALSRAVELLLLSFQEGRYDGNDFRPQLTLTEYEEFIRSLGATVVYPKRFEPFFCEILEVRPASDEEAEIELSEIVWPAAQFGDLLLQRAGCIVTGGSARIDKTTAETSCLYWAFRRKNRPYEDLSQGWGHNSQWRTNFRRDYVKGKWRLFNADGKQKASEPGLKDGSGDPDPLTVDQRLELLRHRHFVGAGIGEEELWPYEYRLLEKVSPE